jgi:hypothetical protein
MFASLDEFHAAKDNLGNEVAHILQTEQAKDTSVALQSWGVLSSTTGEIVESFDTVPDN